MDAAQRASFERLGYLVLKDVVPQYVIAEANELFDQMLARGGGTLAGSNQADSGASQAGRRYGLGPGEPPRPVRDRHGNEYEGRRFLGAPYRYLIDAPGVLPILQEILGDPALGHVLPAVPPAKRPLIRLDHNITHYKPPSTGLASVDKGGGLHGNPPNW